MSFLPGDTVQMDRHNHRGFVMVVGMDLQCRDVVYTKPSVPSIDYHYAWPWRFRRCRMVLIETYEREN